MKIAVIGAAGRAGTEIAREALSRGHEVAAIVRNPDKLQVTGVDVLQKDIRELTADDLKSFDAVVNAFAAPEGQEQLYVEAGRILIEALKQTPETKLFVVGGAGSLYVDEALTTRLLDTPEFPEAFRPIAAGMAQHLDELKQEEGITWTFLSPSAWFVEGKRTGKLTLGEEQLTVNTQGNSYVSYADYAIAVLDELEQPKYINRRFTVASDEE
jgi:uncharacterized protein